MLRRSLNKSQRVRVLRFVIAAMPTDTPLDKVPPILAQVDAVLRGRILPSTETCRECLALMARCDAAFLHAGETGTWPTNHLELIAENDRHLRLAHTADFRRLEQELYGEN